MGTVYEYKGTSYELPDGLTNEAALAKIKASLGEAEPVPEVQPEAQTQTQPVQQERGIVDSLGRQIGLTTRAGLTGLSYPVNAALDFVSGAYNVGANLLCS